MNYYHITVETATVFNATTPIHYYVDVYNYLYNSLLMVRLTVAVGGVSVERLSASLPQVYIPSRESVNAGITSIISVLSTEYPKSPFTLVK